MGKKLNDVFRDDLTEDQQDIFPPMPSTRRGYIPGRKPDLWSFAESWPSPYVSRDKVGEFSGGILHPRTQANLDALGKGCRGRIRVNGKKIAYPVYELIKWLEEHSEIVDDEEVMS